MYMNGQRAFITSGKYQDEDIKEAILQVCSDIDKPDPPGPAAKKSFYRKIVSMKDEDRRRFKKRLLVLEKKGCRGNGPALFRSRERAIWCGSDIQ